MKVFFYQKQKAKSPVFVTLPSIQIFKQIQKHGELESLAHVICIKALDAEGKKLFDSGDWIELINKADPAVITDVANKIIRLGEGRTEEGDESDIEEIKKN